ncbi:hypothetical protein ACFYWU_33275 [Streptomyces chrestomyceticus]|uniref:hypothetical protein n=2 Tax=Streptomyces chrestomyceticus TaxID=68185 RepID=UPI00369F040F
MSKAVFNISRAQDSRQFAAPPGYQAWGSLTSGKFSGELADGEVLAHVHRCETEVPTAPLFLITHPSGPSRTICTVSAPAGGAGQRKEREYTVHGPAGDYAGRIVHGRSPRGIRQAWHIHTPAGTQAAAGYKGSLRGWFAYWVTVPLWPLFAVMGLLHDGGGPSTWMWDKPARITWRPRPRGRGGVLMRFTWSYSLFTWYTERLNASLTHAQAVLYLASLSKDS